MKALKDHIEWSNYAQLRGVLSEQGEGLLEPGQMSVNERLIVSHTGETTLVSDGNCIWRFGPDDLILSDVQIIPSEVLFRIHAGATVAAVRPIKTGNPVRDRWLLALQSATTPLQDTGVLRAAYSPWVSPLYHRLFDLGGEPLVIADRYLRPLHMLGQRVRYMGSAPDAAIVAWVDAEAVAAIMPMVANEHDHESVRSWDWFYDTLTALRAHSAVAS